MIGSTISHYRIVDKLGEGGMGVVYKAHDTRLDRSIAIKVLPRQEVADSERRRRFVQEARAASALNHPNIVTVYDIDRAGGVDFIAMEYIPGKTLDRLIPRRGMRLNEALKYAIQIADALAAAHAAGIVHRDLKPGNIVVTDQGVVKVLDFGLAKLVEKTQVGPFDATQTLRPRTQEGTILGTVAYMSPEQAKGEPVDERSDVFAFGSLLYEMVTGQRAFPGKSTLTTLSAILSHDPAKPSKIVESLPSEIDAIIRLCLQKDPEHRLRNMRDLKVVLQDLYRELESNRSGGKREDRFPRWKWWAAGAAIPLLLLGGTLYLLLRPATQFRPLVLERLTADAGLSAFPFLSADGRFLAFASDRAGEGNLDIWVQQVGGGVPLRITRHETDDSQPALSPDGTKVAFHSERDGGGVYVAPALGGEARLIARGGRGPRFSPDGNWIAYWTGDIGAAPVPGSAAVFVAPADGGEPRQIRPEFAVVHSPIWTPDGKGLLVFAMRDSRPTEDWWIMPVEGGTPVRTGVRDLLRRHDLTPPPGEYVVAPGTWLARGGEVLFSASLGDSTSLWRVRLSPRTWRVEGEPRRFSWGTSLELHPSVAAGPSEESVAFASLTLNVDVWSLPVEPNQGKVTGDLQRVTKGLAFDASPSTTADGKRMIYVRTGSGSSELWLRDLDTGAERLLLARAFRFLYSRLSGDGSRAAFWDEGRRSFLLDTRAGDVQALCESCGPPTHVSFDGRKVLLESVGVPEAVLLVDAASGKRIPIAEPKQPQHILYGGHFSPDERWIAFHAVTGNPAARQIFVVPLRETPVLTAGEWIPVSDGLKMDREANWSPDGNLLYFLSERDGFRCLWAQRLDPASKHPLGAAFPVQHFHHARLSFKPVGNLSFVGPAVGRDKIVFALAELTGNIWKAKVPSE